MDNPLNDVTQDLRDDEGNPLRRVYVGGGVPQAPGDPMGTGGNALSQLSASAPVEAAPWTIEDLQKGLAALKDYVVNGEFSPGTKIGNRMFGTGGEERYQMWPEKMVRSAVTAPGNALASVTPVTSEQMIAPAQDIAGMATGSMLFGKPGAGTLGSGPMKPGAKPVPTEAAPIFYSALEHVVTNAAQDAMPASQWLGFLKNQPGVKAEELAWTGLPEWLGAQKGKVSKEDVKAYLDEHKVEIKDVTKTGKDVDTLAPDFDEQAATNIARQHPEWSRDSVNFIDGVAWEADRLAAAHTGEGGGTKYSSYQLPGGENYREHLLTMPQKNPLRIEPVTAVSHRLVDTNTGEMVAHGTPEAMQAKLREMQPWAQGVAERSGNAPYKSSHWDEPNVLAHVRTNDRYMPVEGGATQTIKRGSEAINREIDQLNTDLNDGKIAGKDYLSKSKALMEELNAARDKETSGQPVESRDIKGVKSLHIEEIQSDWHQQGRKRGYKEEVTKEKREAVAKRDADMRNEFDDAVLQAYEKHHGNTTNVTPRHVNGWRDKILQADGKIDELPSWANTPEIQKAAQDYSGAFNEALALDKKRQGVPDAPFKTTWPELALKRMIRHAAENGYERISWTPGEAQAARYDLSKTISKIEHTEGGPSGQKGITAYDHNGRKIVDRYVKDEELPDVIGKEAAEKLLKQDAKSYGEQGMKMRTLEGLDLKVGGEGMRKFYDKMLPKMVEKLGKAHGVKVKKGSISGNAGVRGGETVNIPPREIYDTLSQHDPKVKEQFPAVSDFVDYYNDLTTAKRAELIEKTRQQGTTPVWYFDLPESLRHHAVGKGFPLYMSGVPFPLTPVDHNPFKKEK